MVVLDDKRRPGAYEDWNIRDYHQMIRLSRGPQTNILNAKLELPSVHPSQAETEGSEDQSSAVMGGRQSPNKKV